MLLESTRFMSAPFTACSTSHAIQHESSFSNYSYMSFHNEGVFTYYYFWKKTLTHCKMNASKKQWEYKFWCISHQLNFCIINLSLYSFFSVDVVMPPLPDAPLLLQCWQHHWDTSVRYRSGFLSSSTTFTEFQHRNRGLQAQWFNLWAKTFSCSY